MTRRMDRDDFSNIHQMERYRSYQVDLKQSSRKLLKSTTKKSSVKQQAPSSSHRSRGSGTT